MLLRWIRRLRYRRILDKPFPEVWRAHLRRNMGHFAYLNSVERNRLETLIQLFVAKKHWEGCGGLELTDEIRVTIAGQACLLVLGLEDPHKLRVPYSNVDSILVYPSTVVPKRLESSIYQAPVVVRPEAPLIGEAHGQGPVILTWDAVRRGGRHPTSGHNVVYHELAHKLDMLDGSVDGTPPLPNRRLHQRWVQVCTRVYEDMQKDLQRGAPTLFDPYAGTDAGEFFAVATELFFERPMALRSHHPELYELLQLYYRQDTAARVQRAGV